MKKSFQREVKRLCGGNVYRKGALERAQTLAALCDAYSRAVAAAHHVRLEENHWVGPERAIDLMSDLHSCSGGASKYFREHTFGLGISCRFAKEASKDYPNELAKASYFLQRQLP